MNESSLNPHNSLLLKQHYLFNKSGDIGVGYFPYRDKMIVVLFDGSHSTSFTDIKNFSNTRIVEQDFARRDWNARVEDERLHCQFVKRETLTEKEIRIRAVLFGLAVRCRDYEEGKAEAEADTVYDTHEDFTTMIKKIIGELKTQNKMHTTQKSSYYESNTQYALEA